jgi:iron(III) transport system substrate-binding protein
MISRRLLLRASACAAVATAVSACDSEKPANQVTLYTAVDEPVARPIIQSFERATGIKVTLHTDTEANKTAGLAETLEAERSNPRADVWWSNEIFHTINLANAGILAPYAAPVAANIPDLFKDAQKRWAGTALRARVIAVHTKHPVAPHARSVQALCERQFRGKICMAKPNAGTTAGHVAAMYTQWGKANAESFLRDLKANGVTLLGGNSVVAEQVASGQMLLGLTDNDDVAAMKRNGGAIDAVLPDQFDGGAGTLMIPCTAALVAGAKNPGAAKKLIDHLLSPEVEKQLLAAQFAGYSVFDPKRPLAMPVDYAKAAANLRSSIDSALTILEGR